MSWRAIDFRGIVDLDRRIVDQLEMYLEEKETRLSHQILDVIPAPIDSDSPMIPPGSGSLKLSEAVDGFSKKVRAAITAGEKTVSPEFVKKEINAALWSFTEVLEGGVVELFQQLRQVPINRWHLSISYVVKTIKDMFIHRIDDLVWVVRRLEKPLQDFSEKFQSTPSTWKEWSFFSDSHVDRNILRNLQKTEKYLHTRFAAFNQRYTNYMSLSAQAEEHLDEMKNYPVLALLDVPDQNLYVDVFRLLKVLELDTKAKKAVTDETIQAIKQLTSIDHIIQVFRAYKHEIKEAFVKSSLEWKSLDRQGEKYDESVEKLQVKVKDYQEELKQLTHMISRYRLFILKNDPNPYVRSRWGFSEWIVGPEPVKSKKLLNMIYACEELQQCFTQFEHSLERNPLEQHHQEVDAHDQIESLLHEMGQPLMSRTMMHNRVETLLDQLKRCDEIGSPRISTIPYVGDVLSKAMREDWKYLVLYEFPLFHHLYRQHLALSENYDDPSHAFRLEQFCKLFNKMEEWINKEGIFTHAHEIELDMNDMKTYLQDFLASIQRVVKEGLQNPFLDETIHKCRQQLLEYRYLFGQFFSAILTKSPEGIQLRNQFLYVDQYFESVENLLNELKLIWEGKVR